MTDNIDDSEEQEKVTIYFDSIHQNPLTPHTESLERFTPSAQLCHYPRHDKHHHLQQHHVSHGRHVKSSGHTESLHDYCTLNMLSHPSPSQPPCEYPDIEQETLCHALEHEVCDQATGVNHMMSPNSIVPSNGNLGYHHPSEESDSSVTGDSTPSSRFRSSSLNDPLGANVKSNWEMQDSSYQGIPTYENAHVQAGSYLLSLDKASRVNSACSGDYSDYDTGVPEDEYSGDHHLLVRKMLLDHESLQSDDKQQPGTTSLLNESFSQNADNMPKDNCVKSAADNHWQHHHEAVAALSLDKNSYRHSKPFSREVDASLIGLEVTNTVGEGFDNEGLEYLDEMKYCVDSDTLTHGSNFRAQINKTLARIESTHAKFNQQRQPFGNGVVADNPAAKSSSPEDPSRLPGNLKRNFSPGRPLSFTESFKSRLAPLNEYVFGESHNSGSDGKTPDGIAPLARQETMMESVREYDDISVATMLTLDTSTPIRTRSQKSIKSQRSQMSQRSQRSQKSQWSRKSQHSLKSRKSWVNVVTRGSKLSLPISCLEPLNPDDALSNKS
ncbi:hypothetical protein SK128_023610, partial [Halocaridina rubra]